MAYTAANLQLNPVAPGDAQYIYDAGDDSMLTVAAANYFLDSNSANSAGLAAEALIWCQCTDGNMWLRVSSASATAITTQFAGGNLPINTFATGTAAELSGSVFPGVMEFGPSISTASRVVLPTPYPGAEFRAIRIGSATAAIEFDAGGSGATAIVLDATGNRRITSRFEGDFFHVVGRSTTRWQLYAFHFNSSGSEDLGGGASAFFGAT